MQTNILNHTAIITLFFLLTAVTNYSQPAGIPDPTFGNNGKVLTKIQPNKNEDAQSVAVTPDNKIVVAGNTHYNSGLSNIGIIRYLQDGTLDATFNSTGTKLIMNGYVNALAVQPDNKIIVCGSVSEGTQLVFGLWRLKSNGDMDSTFGIAGYRTVAFESGNVICYALTLQPDGKILIGGSTQSAFGGYSNLVVARLNENGTLDNDFAFGGRFSLSLDYRGLSCQRILLQEKKIVIAGQYDTLVSGDYFQHYMFAMRLKYNGTVDSTFGENGGMRYGSANYDHCYSAGILPDSRIVLSGFSEYQNRRAASVVCLNKNGSIDRSFGVRGWQYIDFKNGSFSNAYATVIQKDGKIIIGGSTNFSDFLQSVFLARLNSNGSFDLSFANNGKDTFFSSTKDIGCNDADLQADGRIVIAGYQERLYDNYLTARFLNGSLSTTAKNPVKDITPSLSPIVFPNPVLNKILNLNIDLTKPMKVTISVYNMNGSNILPPYTIEKGPGLSRETIKLPPAISCGTYICVVNANSETYKLRFVVGK